MEREVTGGITIQSIKKQIVTYLDKKHGKVQVFYKNNNKLRYEGNYNNGLMDGNDLLLGEWE